jgi:hypothetical protein
MRKHIIFKLGQVFLIWGLIVLTGCTDSEEANSENSVTMDEKKEEESDLKDSNSILEGLFKDYQEEGEKCKTIEDTIERGDCFQVANSNQLNWYIDNSKELFYFPFQREQEHWQNVIYFEIDDADELSEIRHTANYENYLDKGNSEAHIEHGATLLENYWYVFSNIIPKTYRQDLGSIAWADTGNDYVFAVGRDHENVQELQLLISHNMGEYRTAFKKTLIHEFGHMLTLNDSQGKVDTDLFFSDNEAEWEAAEEACPTILFWGCMEESGYLNQYYLSFWEDINAEYEEIDWESEDHYKNFFFKYEDRFFNSYQGTNPVEDIAEAFTIFVMMNSNDLEGKTEIKYEKLKFFYQYDELVELRTMILENMYDLVVADQEFY